MIPNNNDKAAIEERERKIWKLLSRGTKSQSYQATMQQATIVKIEYLYTAETIIARKGITQVEKKERKFLKRKSWDLTK